MFNFDDPYYRSFKRYHEGYDCKDCKGCEVRRKGGNIEVYRRCNGEEIEDFDEDSVGDDSDDDNNK